MFDIYDDIISSMELLWTIPNFQKVLGVQIVFENIKS